MVFLTAAGTTQQKQQVYMDPEADRSDRTELKAHGPEKLEFDQASSSLLVGMRTSFHSHLPSLQSKKPSFPPACSLQVLNKCVWMNVYEDERVLFLSTNSKIPRVNRVFSEISVIKISEQEDLGAGQESGASVSFVSCYCNSKVNCCYSMSQSILAKSHRFNEIHTF